MAHKKTRLNSNAAVAREDLKFALKDKMTVQRAIDRSECMLCCETSVNETGLCIECFSRLDDAERKLCEVWLWKVDM